MGQLKHADEVSPIARGSHVFNPSGKLLGHVVSCGAEGCTVRKGFILPQLVVIAYEDMAEVVGNEVWLRRDPTVFAEADAAVSPMAVDEKTLHGLRKIRR